MHTSDYKLDHTPVDGFRTDVGRLAELGNRGVDLRLGDSTNAERPGFTVSERLVGEAFRQIIPLRKGRIFVASFASNVHRMQQAIDVAVEAGRKVFVIGRSMRKNLNIARSLGYLEVPDDVLIRPAELEDYAPHELLVLCTGSQGEPMSALTRIAYRDHAAVDVERGDTVYLGETGARERAAGARHDQRARPGRCGGAAPGDRAGSRLGTWERRGDPHRDRARAAEGCHAGPRRVPHVAAQARMAEEAGVPATRSCWPRTVPSSSVGRWRRLADPSTRESCSWTGLRSATSATSLCATVAACPRTACSSSSPR